MTETPETEAAYDLRELAIRKAHPLAGPGDLEVKTLAILMEALILSTPRLSAERRAWLFLENEE